MTTALSPILDRHGRPLPAAKAVTGDYAWQPLYQPYVGNRRDGTLISMWDAQAVYLGNRHVRKAERVISQRFGSVPWHLEDGDGQRIGSGDDENSDEAYLAVAALLERPYKPAPGDPQSATPRTRSGLWGLTSRHMGVCGPSYWFLDQMEAKAGTPTQMLYINPARITPYVQGGMLTRWVLDAEKPTQMYLDLREVIQFGLEQPDHGFIPTGLVQTAATMVGLTRTTDRHSTQLVESGGRMVGVYSPKAGSDTIEEEAYKQLKADLNTVADMSDSTKRSVILRGPIDFQQTSATSDQMHLVELMDMSGSQIAELWGVPSSQMSRDLPAGLNSGQTKSYDEAVLWQGAIGPRLSTFTETLQYELLDRYADLGLTITLVVDQPSFDDEAPRYQLAKDAITLPLTNQERREMVGLEPFPDVDGKPDPRNEEVWLASTMSKVYPELAPFTGQAPPPPQGNVQDNAPQEAAADQRPNPAGKARDDATERLRKDLQVFLDRWGHRIGDRVTDRSEHLARKPTDSSVWWDAEAFEAQLADVLDPHVRDMTRAENASVNAQFGAGKASLSALLPRLLRKVGIDIKGISRHTRDLVKQAVKDGIEQGLSGRELGDLIRTSAGFSEARAETIARTETGNVLNGAAIESYRQYDVSYVTVDDSDRDEICAAVNGATWTLEEADNNPLGHPNAVVFGTRVAPLGMTDAGYRARWSGPVVTLVTASGARLTVTPKHPVLTGRGWVDAESLRPGDHLVHRDILDDPVNGSHLNQMPTRIEHVLSALGEQGSLTSGVASPDDLHGDAQFVQGKVEVVLPERPLATVGYVSLVQHPSDRILDDAGMEHAYFAGPSACFRRGGSVPLTPTRSMGSSHMSGVLVAPSRLDAEPTQALSDAAVADAELCRELSRRYACRVSLDELVRVERSQWSGQIFDLQTTGRAYFAEGMIISNCVRSFTPIVGSPA